MKVPFGDLKVHYQTYKNELDVAVQRVLDSGHFILGPELASFEKSFAEFVGVPFVSGCASGTEAIYLALAALGVGGNDDVLVVSHTAVPTISAISMTGARPVFIDIQPDTCLMDVSVIETKITAKTKAIIPVHLYGQMVDMEPILKTAAKHGIFVVEDVAQATGATYRGAQAGTLGDFAAFSFYPSKNLGAFGDGGAVATSDKGRHERVNMLRNYGQSTRYQHDIVGINSRLDEMQSAILSAQLPFVRRWNRRRREIAERYTAGLKTLVQTPTERSSGEHVYHLYVIQVDERDALKNYLAERDIQCLIHYPIPAHLQKAYECLGNVEGDLPVTERVANRILSLPIFPELTDDQVDHVIGALKDFYRLRSRTGKQSGGIAIGNESAVAQRQ
jgi:dTDP-4-amino-4,6-dideoxygalactose transaminase